MVSKISFLIVLFSMLPVYLFAGDPDPLFSSDKILKIEIRTNLRAILAERDTLAQYHDGTLIIKKGSKPLELNVKVTSRGNFRRNPVNCGFPPLTINFKKSEVKETIFSNQDKLKLVTACQSDTDVIEEYLIYKMYNKVTDFSLNVRLVSVTFFDTGKNEMLYESYCFFIEDDDRAAERNNAKAFDKFMTPFDLERENFQKLAVFQYMIGNKDWFVTSRKNIILMQPQAPGALPIAVPYDFDFAGFVNADYTRPKNVPLEYLADRRVYKGLCDSNDSLYEVLAGFTVLKPAFEDIIMKMKLLQHADRLVHMKYLTDFYSAIQDREYVRTRFLEACEKPEDYNIVR